jgi:DNA transposition AAA+ family ATPase
MKREFVKTSNYERFIEGIAALEGRGAVESSLMLVTGEAGFGKSETVDRYAAFNGAAYLRAKTEWTPHYFMAELANVLKVDSSGRARDLFGRISGSLLRNQTPIVIDEVEHCLRNSAAVLESIRDLSDLTEVTVILIGMEQVQAKIARYPQISSRIAHVVNFGPATLDDVKRVCAGLCDVGVADDLAAEVQKQAKGRMREVMNAIAMIEREGRSNGLKTVELKHMGNRPLTLDWQARRPRAVPLGAR